jgi:hypothetical protein
MVTRETLLEDPQPTVDADCSLLPEEETSTTVIENLANSTPVALAMSSTVS